MIKRLYTWLKRVFSKKRLKRRVSELKKRRSSLFKDKNKRKPKKKHNRFHGYRHMSPRDRYGIFKKMDLPYGKTQRSV